MTCLTIISGGQTGVDRSALDVAIKMKIPHRGWCPPDRKADDGFIPKKYNLTETPEERSQFAIHIPRSLRTEWNVRNSDGTLILSRSKNVGDPGSIWTFRFAKMYNKPIIQSDPENLKQILIVVKWLVKHKIEVLNVAGPAEKTEPGITKQAYIFLNLVFKKFLSISG